MHGASLRLEDGGALLQDHDLVVQVVHVLAVAAEASVGLPLANARAWHARRSVGSRAAEVLHGRDVRIDGVDVDLQNEVAVFDLLDEAVVHVDLLPVLGLRLSQDAHGLLESPQLAPHKLLDCACGRRTHAGLDLHAVLHDVDLRLQALQVHVDEVKGDIRVLPEGSLQVLGAHGPVRHLLAELVEPVAQEIHLVHVPLILLHAHALVGHAVQSPKLRRVQLVLSVRLQVVDRVDEAPLEVGVVLLDVLQLLHDEDPEVLRRAARLQVLEAGDVHDRELRLGRSPVLRRRRSGRTNRRARRADRLGDDARDARRVVGAALGSGSRRRTHG